MTNKFKEQPLVDQIDKLKADFRKLRQRTIWHRHVLGGVFAMHMVGETRPERWLPHIHILAPAFQMEGLPWSDCWRKITGDSHLVYVEPAPFTEDEKFRLPNYIVKDPATLFAHNKPMMDEFVEATKRKPLIGTIGLWRGIPLTRRPSPPLSAND